MIHSKEKEPTKEMGRNTERYKGFQRGVTQKPRNKAFKTKVTPNVCNTKTSSYFIFSGFYVNWKDI